MLISQTPKIYLQELIPLTILFMTHTITQIIGRVNTTTLTFKNKYAKVVEGKNKLNIEGTKHWTSTLIKNLWKVLFRECFI